MLTSGQRESSWANRLDLCFISSEGGTSLGRFPLFAPDVANVNPHVDSATILHPVWRLQTLLSRQYLWSRDSNGSGCSLLYLGQGRKGALADLGDDVDIRIDDLGNIILHAGSEHRRYFRGIETVILLEPTGEIGRASLQGVVQRSTNPHGHEVLVVFGARARGGLVEDEIDGELDVHRSFQGIAGEFAIPLRGVTVAHEQ